MEIPRTADTPAKSRSEESPESGFRGNWLLPQGAFKVGGQNAAYSGRRLELREWVKFFEGD